MSATIELAERASEGDYIVIRNTNKKIQLEHFPHGLTARSLALSTRETFVIPPHRGMQARLVLRPGRQFSWPEDTPLTGKLSPFEDVRGIRVVPIDTINTIEDKTNDTLVFLQNITDDPVVFTPGDTVANFDPVLLETETDAEGNDLLYRGPEGNLHRSVQYIEPGIVGHYECTERPKQFAPIPVAILKVSIDKDRITEQVIPIERELDQDVVLDNNIDDRIALGEKPAYSYKDCKVNENVSTGDRKLVDQFLERKQKFFSPITKSYPNKQMPEFSKQRIVMKDNHQRFECRAYPMSQYKQQIMKQIIEDQLQKGMIRPSQSPYASPAFLVPKAGGSGHRLVVDMRLLNKSVEKSTWPIPRIYEILDKLAGTHYFTTLDLVDGFHQCELEEDSRKYTAFKTQFGTFEYNTSPMGLISSPNHFQFVMSTILSGRTKQTSKTATVWRQASSYGRAQGDPLRYRYTTYVKRYISSGITGTC